MPIVNSVIPYLAPNDVIEQRAQNAVFSIDDFKDFNYYWVEYATWDCLLNLHKVLPDNVLEDIKAGNLTLVLYHSHEANVEVVESIYQNAIIDLKIPEDCIHIYTESPTIKTTIKEVAGKLGKKTMRCFNLLMFENMIQQNSRYEAALSKKSLVTLESKTYEKKFLNFNRRWRWHRPALVAHMCLEGVLDKGYVSLGPCDNDWGWENAWHHILRTHSHHPNIRQQLIDNKEKIFSIPSLFLDQQDLQINHCHLLPSTLDLYRNTYFSVVTETNFFLEQEPALFLTEKIFKPIAHKHPFIVLGRPKTLSLLKDIGYTTFSNIIDESYDEQTDDVTRMMMILKEIKRLCELSTTELEKFLSQARLICEQNHRVLLSKKRFVREITDDPRY